MGDSMNILHYSLGLPPYRTGGLTKYSFDLMKEQAINGEKVYLLFPGKITFLDGRTSIRYYKNESGIRAYEIINPLPVPLLNGISEPQNFMKSCDKKIFKDFLIENVIEIVHIHTLMGLHKEFLEACKDLNIKIVYTTHDYFGLCTKVNFIDDQGNLCEEKELERCLKCNKSGYSMEAMKILQSPTYRFIKNKGIISKLKPLAKRIRNNKKTSLVQHNIELKTKKEDKDLYIKLADYYKHMFGYIDVFLFNSTVAKEVYDKYLEKINGEIISITHGDIKDNRKIRIYNDKDKLKLTYLGPDRKHKGFDLLMNAIKELNKEYKSKIELNLYGDIQNREVDDNIKIHGKYSYDQLNGIFDNTDLLIAPSIWNETFGFIVLEAISYGVPVMVTDMVGSKDIIIGNKFPKGIVTKVNKEELKYKIIEVINDRTTLEEFNKNILEDSFNFNMHTHLENIKVVYKKI